MQKQFDSDLGLLEFQDVEGMFSYNCKMTLPISKREVEVFFETDSADRLPTVEQKIFMQHIISNYNNFLESIETELPEEVKIFIEEKKSTLKEEFDLDTMGISLDADISHKWDLSLVSHSNKPLSLLANFDRSRLIKVWVEKQSRQGLFLKLLSKFISR